MSVFGDFTEMKIGSFSVEPAAGADGATCAGDGQGDEEETRRSEGARMCAKTRLKITTY